MKPHPSSQHNEQDQEVIKLLEGLGALTAAYPPELLNARRTDFLAQVERLTTADIDEELSVDEQEIVYLLGILKSASIEYPPHLLAAKRSALLQQLGLAETLSVFDQIRGSIQRIFSYKTALPDPSGSLRIPLVVASLILVAFFGSLLFRRAEQTFRPPLLQNTATPSPSLTTPLHEAAISVCNSENPEELCAPGELDPSQDLANTGNGSARPAVSNEGVYKAAYMNDGREGASWVSNSPDSWIKIDLGQVKTINMVSLQNGKAAASGEENPGQFVIAVALSDMYTDGDSNNDDVEYAQVFDSEQTGFSGRASQADTIRTQFSSVQARYVKITFKETGAAIKEVGIFMIDPLTRTPEESTLEITLTPTLSLTSSATSTIVTQLLTDTVAPTSTDTSALADTPSPAPTTTPPPIDTPTPVPTEPIPSDTPVPLLTASPPTAVPPTIQQPPANTDPIVVTGDGQTLTFTCNGNAAEIRGHANTVTLLGSCSSITVTGNNNNVFWQFGSPIITNRGRDNIILQL